MARYTITLKAPRVSEEPVCSAPALYKLWKEFEDADQEHFLVLGLNVRNRIVYNEVLSMGTQSTADVDLRLLFRRLLEVGAFAFLVGHNHPSGSTEPSGEDVALTKRIYSVAQLLGMPFLDHIILGEGEYYSFQERGLMDTFHDRTLTEGGKSWIPQQM